MSGLTQFIQTLNHELIFTELGGQKYNLNFQWLSIGVINGLVLDYLSM